MFFLYISFYTFVLPIHSYSICSCVVVEDSTIGLAAAKAAGMKCIVTKSGYNFLPSNTNKQFCYFMKIGRNFLVKLFVYYMIRILSE
jgi:hypothetical protein